MASGEMLSDDVVVAEVMVSPATLSVGVVARQFRVELDAVRNTYTQSFGSGIAIEDNGDTQLPLGTINVKEDITIESLWVAVSITHQRRNNLKIELVPPGGGTPLVLHDQIGSNSAQNVRRVYTSQNADIPLNSLLGTGAQGDWTLTVGDYMSDNFGTLEGWGIGFGAQARVVAGDSTMLTVRLVGVNTALGSPMLFMGETVFFHLFKYRATEIRTDAAVESFEFTAESLEGGIVLTVPVDIIPGTLFAEVRGPMNAVMEPPFVAWWVDIEPREFALSFITPEGAVLDGIQVLAGGATEVAVRLSGMSPLIAGETLTVDLMYGGTGVSPSLSPLTLTFGSTEEMVTLTAEVDATDGTLTATGGGLVNARVEDALLPVEIVPREFALSFVTLESEVLDEIQVPAGGSTEVTVRLSGVSPLVAGEILMVDLMYDGAGVSPSSSTLLLPFGSSTEVKVTLNAAAGATSGTLTATGNGLANATVASASLPVEILPREFALSFVTPEGAVLDTARVLAGGSIEVMVRLSGVSSLAMDEALMVDLMYDGADVSLSSSTLSLPFGSSTEVKVTLNAAAGATSGILTATGNGLANATVAEVSVSVVILPREFALVFAPPEIGILTGTTETVTLSLSGASLLLPGEKVVVGLSLLDGGTVSLVPMGGSLTFGASTPSHEVELMIPLDASTGVARLLASVLELLSNLEGAVFLDAELLVNVVDKRTFAWVFRAVETREELQEAVVVAGAATRLLVSLEGVAGERLGDGEQVEAGLSLTFGLAGVAVSPSTLVMSAGAMSREVVLTAEVSAMPGTLELRVTRTTPATLLPSVEIMEPPMLPITILPRAFALSFVTLESEVLDEIQVLAGGSTEVVVRLSGVSPLVAGETLTVDFMYDGADVGLSSSSLTLTSDNTEVVVTLTAAFDATDGTLTATGSGLVNARVAPVPLPVEILPREFALSFTTLAGMPLPTTVRVLAGGAAALMVRLSGASFLTTGEVLPVDFLYDGVGVNLIVLFPVTLMLGSTEALVALNVSVDATDGILTTASSGLVNARVMEASLPFEILPREFALSFVTPEGAVLDGIQVLAGGATEVAVRLSGVSSLVAGEILMVDLMYGGTGVSPSFSPLTLVFDSTETVVTLNMSASATDGTLTATGRGLANATVVSSSLPVEILPREFALSFVTPESEALDGIHVLAGGATEVAVRLSGVSPLVAGEILMVDFMYAGTGVSPSSSPLTLVFGSTEVAVTLNMSASATDGTLTATGRGLANATVVSSSLPVEILPREFALSFITPEGAVLDGIQVLAGGATEVVVRLSGVSSLAMGETLVVDFMYDGTGVSLSSSPLSLVFGSTEVAVTLNMSASATDGTLTATGRGLANATVALSSLLVEILPREFALSFVTLTGETLDGIRVLADGSIEVMVRLSGMSSLAMGETLVVDFMYDGTGVSLSSSPLSLVFGSTEVAVTLNAAAGATSGALTATGSGLVNAVVAPASLPVEILPREFALVFAPPEIGILTGTTETVTLSLTGASLVAMDPAVTVGLTLSHPDRLTLMTPDTLTFDANTRIYAVTLMALESTTVLEGATLTATVAAGHGVPNALFADAELLVNVVDKRTFAWVFRAVETGDELQEAVVVAGAATRLLVSLEGVAGERLGDGEQVEAVLSLTSGLAGVAVSPSTLVMSAGAMSREVVLTADVGALPGTLALRVTRTTPIMLPRAEIMAAPMLPIKILPREFALSFETLSGTPLATAARVLAGGATEVVVVLSNAGVLLESESVRVSLTTETVTTVPGLTLTNEMSSTTLTIGADYDATSPLGVVASGEVLSSDGISVLNTRVLSATLPVEVVARRFQLLFSDEAGFPVSVARILAGGSLPLRVRVAGVETSLGPPSLGEGETLMVELPYLSGTGVMASSPTVEFSAGSTEVTVTLNAALDATDGTLTAITLTAMGNRLVNATVEEASLSIKILPREFGLSFETLSGVPLATTARVLVGASTEVVVVLSNAGALLASESVRVSLTTETVTVDSSSVTLTAEMPSKTLTISAAADVESLLGTVVATGAVELNGSVVDNTQVESATLTVDVVARRFRLSIESVDEAGVALISERVVAGGTTEVVVRVSGVETPLGISRLFADEAVRVDFVYEGGEGVTLSSVLLGSGNPTPYLGEETRSTATVTALLAATDGALVLAGSGLSNAEIEPVTLAVTILPREFRLVFIPPEIGILTGTTETVTLSLTGASLLLPGEKVVVGLSLLDDSTVVSLVSMGSLTFGASTLSHAVELAAGASTGATTLLASVESSPTNLGDVAFLDGELRVNVVEKREFRWVFRLVGTEDGMTQLLVTLEGVRGERLGPDETVEVDVAVFNPAGTTIISIATLMVSEGIPSLVATLSSDTFATPGAWQFLVTNQMELEDELERAQVAPQGTFDVFGLQFEMQGMVVTMAEVLAGGMTEVMVALVDPEGLLGDGEEVRVRLEATTVNIAPMSVTLTKEDPSTALFIGAAADVGSLSGTIVATGAVVLGGLMVDDAVVGAALAVTVVERRFALMLMPDTLQIGVDKTKVVLLKLVATDGQSMLVEGEEVKVMVTAEAGNPEWISLSLTEPMDAFTRENTGENAAVGVSLTLTTTPDAEGAEGSMATWDIVVTPLNTEDIDPVSLTATLATVLRLRIRVLLEGPLQ